MWGATYLSGCTDENYLDGHCPNKGHDTGESTARKIYDIELTDSVNLGTPWLGLTYCDQIGWITCPASPGKPTTITGPVSCECPTDSTVAKIAIILGNINLDPHAKLPTRANNPIIWYPGYTPTLSITSTNAKTYSNSHSPPAPAPAPTPTPDPDPITSEIPPSIPTATRPPECPCSVDTSDLVTKTSFGAFVAFAVIMMVTTFVLLMWFNWHKVQIWWKIKVKKQRVDEERNGAQKPVVIGHVRYEGQNHGQNQGQNQGHTQGSGSSHGDGNRQAGHQPLGGGIPLRVVHPRVGMRQNLVPSRGQVVYQEVEFDQIPHRAGNQNFPLGEIQGQSDNLSPLPGQDWDRDQRFTSLNQIQTRTQTQTQTQDSIPGISSQARRDEQVLRQDSTPATSFTIIHPPQHEPPDVFCSGAMPAGHNRRPSLERTNDPLPWNHERGRGQGRGRGQIPFVLVQQQRLGRYMNPIQDQGNIKMPRRLTYRGEDRRAISVSSYSSSPGHGQSRQQSQVRNQSQKSDVVHVLESGSGSGQGQGKDQSTLYSRRKLYVPAATPHGVPDRTSSLRNRSYELG